MSLNSNVFIPMGISVADRAALLGHSIETNLKYYSFASKDYLTNARNILNSCQKDDENEDEIIEGTPGNPSNIIFLCNKKALNSSKLICSPYGRQWKYPKIYHVRSIFYV